MNPWSPEQAAAFAHISEQHPGEPLIPDHLGNPDEEGSVLVFAADHTYLLHPDGRIVRGDGGTLTADLERTLGLAA